MIEVGEGHLPLGAHTIVVYSSYTKAGLQDQYGRNEDKVLKCTNIPSDIDSIHNRRSKPSFGDIWSTARGPRHPPFSKKSQKKD